MMGGPVIFGVRHLSPAAAFQLRKALEKAAPDLVLVEGPSDLNDQMKWLCHPDTRFPAAILAYTQTPPVRTILYPFAIYSPEIQAILWAHEHGVECRFMDLPSGVFLALEKQGTAEETAAGAEGKEAAEKSREGAEGKETAEKAREVAEGKEAAEEAKEVAEGKETAEKAKEAVEGKETAEKAEVAEGKEVAEKVEGKEDRGGTETGLSGKEREGLGDTTESVYRRLEIFTGEEHDTFWERNFEQTGERYQEAAGTFGRMLREASSDDARSTAETLVREAYMKRVILQAVAAGIPAEKIFIVCGAFHVAGLEGNQPMTDEEERALPRMDSTATLMPYSYYRLSSRSGYGAGNKAPAYFELLWEAMQGGGLEETPYLYLTRLAAAHRRAGNIVSSAEVIEAARLADTLAAMRGSRYPVLADLRDASVTTMGHGNFSELALAAADTEIGKKIGFLPEGVSRTSVQEDFYRQLKELRLEKYRTAELQELDLDLREKLNVKSRQAALADLRRSFFLHRLRVLGIHFATLLPSRQTDANWGEYWNLRWTPEAEIEIVESSLLGETIETAAAYAMKERAENSATIAQAAAIFEDAFLCGMPTAAVHALSMLQSLSVEAAALNDVTETAWRLSFVIRYGDLRQFRTEPVIPLLKQLYLRACLILEESCICDAKAAPVVAGSMERLNALVLAHDFLEEERLLALLREISDRDDLNPHCSGFALAILLERGIAGEDLLAREVARRLSPGVPADLGAGWFEGLAAKNRRALIVRLSLWRQLDEYLTGLDDTAFRRALVFLRRAFADFSPGEKNDVAENLGEIWGCSPSQAAELIMNETTAEEQEVLSGLEDFDFDDI